MNGALVCNFAKATSIIFLGFLPVLSSDDTVVLLVPENMGYTDI